jgi:imidazoleglycerol phosphate synthase glutamine amidotransferase subunit HisH
VYCVIQKLTNKKPNKYGYPKRLEVNSMTISSNDEDFSSYFGTKRSNYSEEDKIKLKKMYKVLALQFHPDRSGDEGEMMKLVNRLKEDWGI